MISLEQTILLGSKSPRRHALLKSLGLEFTVVDIAYEEEIPRGIEPMHAPLFLAEQKALHYTGPLDDAILITADTLVLLNGEILGKPRDLSHANEMLEALSGRTHTVITGVCIMTKLETILFGESTHVTFKALELDEIRYYIKNFPVLDKAGAYGAQDWLGMVGIESVDGSFFNVMGLPTHALYNHLKDLAEVDL